MDKYAKNIMISDEELKLKVKELGAQISKDYQGKDLLLVCVLKGAVVFLADLMREIKIPLSIDFMAVSSYGSSTSSSGVVRILKDLEEAIENRHLLIIEDIVDTGLTLKYLIENLKSRGPASIKICTLLDKPDRRKSDIVPDYCGYSIPDEFVVGFGLDYAEKYRNLSYIAILDPADY